MERSDNTYDELVAERSRLLALRQRLLIERRSLVLAGEALIDSNASQREKELARALFYVMREVIRLQSRAANGESAPSMTEWPLLPRVINRRARLDERRYNEAGVVDQHHG